MTANGVLTEMCAIAMEALNNRGIRAQRGSIFVRELSQISLTERQEWLRKYVEQRTFLLLQGTIDQVSKLNDCIDVHSPAMFSVTEPILLRSILEYSYRLIYLIDHVNDVNERASRAIRLFYEDTKSYNRVPEELKSGAAEVDPFLRAWYREIAGGGELKGNLTIKEIIETIETHISGDYKITGNSIYGKGYSIWSAIAHSNTWAIRHYGQAGTLSVDGEFNLLPSVRDERTTVLWRVLAARLLYFTFGLSIMFMESPKNPETIDRLANLMHQIQ